MTHEELLKKIDTNSLFDEGGNSDALIAVVELHAPTPEGRYPRLLCHACSMTEVNHYVDYPCRVIQVIEKELL